MGVESARKGREGVGESRQQGRNSGSWRQKEFDERLTRDGGTSLVGRPRGRDGVERDGENSGGRHMGQDDGWVSEKYGKGTCQSKEFGNPFRSHASLDSAGE